MPISQNRGLVARGSIQVDLQRLQSDRRLVLREAKAMSDGVKSSFRGSASAVNGFNQSIESTAARLGKLRGELTAISAVSSGLTFFGLRAADNLRNLQIRFREIAGDQERGLELMEQIGEAAQNLNLPVRETQDAFAGLVPAIRDAGGEVDTYINRVARLSTLNRSEGISGAVFAIREALSSGGTDLVSLAERFNLPRKRLRELIEETGDFAAALDIILNEQGATNAAVESFSDSLGTAATRLRDAGTRALEKAFIPQLDSAVELLNRAADGIDSLPDGLVQFAGGAITATTATTGLALGLSQVLDTYTKLKGQGFFEIGNLRKAALGTAAIGIALNADTIATQIVQQIGNATNNERLQNQDVGQTRNTLKQTGIIIATGILEAGRAFVKALVNFTTPLRTFPQQIELFKAQFAVATGELVVTIGNIIKNLAILAPGTGLAQRGEDTIASGNAAIALGQQRIAEAQTAIQGAQQGVLNAVDATFDTMITNMLIGYGVIEDAANSAEKVVSSGNDNIQKIADKTFEGVSETYEGIARVMREALQDIEQSIRFRTELNQLEREGTIEQVQGRIQGLQDERNAIQELLPELEKLASTNDDAADSLRNYTRRLTEIDSQIDQLTGITPTIARRALDELSTEFADDIRKLEQSRSEDLTNLATRVREDLAELDKDLANEFTDARKEEIEAVQEYQEEQADIYKEHQERLLEIERRGREEISDAAGRLDAAGVRAAKKSREDQREEAEKQFIEEQERNAERLQDTREKLAEERREILDNYARRRADIIAAGNAERAAIQQKYNAEIQSRTQAYNVEAQQLNQYLNQRLQQHQRGLNAELQAQRTGYDAMLQGARSFASRMASIAGSLTTKAGSVVDSGPHSSSSSSKTGSSSLGSTTLLQRDHNTTSSDSTSNDSFTGQRSRTSSGGISAVKRFATGGIANFSGSGEALAFVDKKERVLTQQQTASFDRLVNAISGSGGGGQNLSNLRIDVVGADSVEALVSSIAMQVIGQLFEHQIASA